MNRRDFIKLLGTATGSTLVASCGVQRGTEKLIPYLVPPEDGLIPGQPLFYRTTSTECPEHCGMMVKVHEKPIPNNRYGRFPVKLEGAPGHPINDGTLCIRGQASITRLYHPERLKDPLVRGADGKLSPVTWEEAYAKIAKALGASRGRGHRNVYLSGRTTGSLSALIDTFCNRMDIERLPEFEVFSYAALREAHGVLFGERAIPAYKIEQADFLLTIGADILETYISPTNHALQLSRAKKQDRFEWFHVEPHLSLTGMNANERFVVNPGSEVYLLLFLLSHLKRNNRLNGTVSGDLLASIPDLPIEEVSRRTGLEADRLSKLARPFDRARNPLVITGGVSASQESGLDALVLTGMVQWLAGSHHALIDFARAENYSRVGTAHDANKLSDELQGNQIGVIFLSKTDPVSHMPPSFKESLRNAQLRVGLSDMSTQTMEACDIVLPLSHSLESWGDAKPRKNISSIIQPVLKPLHNTRAEGDILLQLLKAGGQDEPFSTYQEYVLKRWKTRYGEAALEAVLKSGYHETNVERADVQLQEGRVTEYLSGLRLPESLDTPVLMITPSIRWFDGRSSDLPLLHEIPDPVTTISYGRWVSISEQTARRQNLKDGDEIRLTSSNLSLTLPVNVLPGLEGEVYLVHYGMIDSLPLPTSENTGERISYISGLTIKKTGRRTKLPILSGAVSLQGRGIIPYPVHGEAEHHGPVTLYPEKKYKDYRWAMAIDLDLCIGCSACVAACYIENNIPIVGEKEHLIGREMSWIRIEQHNDADGRGNFVPMLCQHCGSAPCEPVCPVFAAYHNAEGLNAQIYNRCVGTRYCSNNCPFKVRRFNWFDHDWPAPMDKMLNPDVSVRTKGIMEKCTFCVQRIRVAKDAAKDESRKVRDGELVPACAQTCPTGAIVFGNLLDHDSRVYELSHSKRAYRIFDDLGVESAIHYLAKDHRTVES